MSASFECKMKKVKCKMKTLGRVVFALFTVTFSLFTGSGCRQKMAEQPYYKPYEPTEFFADGRSARPLERGVIHRAQYLETDPLVTGLARDEWARSYKFRVPVSDIDAPPLTDEQRKEQSVGAPRYAPADAAHKVYADEFPFRITQADLKRGQERYTIFCVACHGPLGNGQGKIWERGYLDPTSFHTKPVTADEDRVRVAERAKGKGDAPGEVGYSRGYRTLGHRVPMDEAPVGYYFEVITKGYGGMPNYAAQIPPADRWRIIAYVRALQMTQRAGTPEAGGKK